MWCRQVMNREIGDVLTAEATPTSTCLEVSGNMWGHLPWRSHRSTTFPELDLLHVDDHPESLSGADVVICEQVLEHVRDPIAAAKGLVALARPGGLVVVSTPFLIHVHRSPGDYWRFTEDGLELVLRSAGLEQLRVDSWGNRRCVKANFGRWARYERWHSLTNEPDYPLVVWASGRRTQEPDVA